MNCLKDYVGLKSCSATPLSGKYINILPGMSTELVDNIANSEQVTYKGVWSDIQDAAYDVFKNDIAIYLRQNKASKFDEVLFQTERIGNISRNPIFIESSLNYNGVYIRVPSSKYTELYIKNLWVYSKTAITTTFKIFDVNDGSTILTQEVDLSIGMNSIPIELTITPSFDTLVIFAGVDATELESIETVRDLYSWEFDDCACANQYQQQLSIFEYWPAQLGLSDEAIFENIQQNGSGFGIGLDADLMCSIDQFICQNKKYLLTAWMYLLASQTLIQKMASYRMNIFTTSNLEATGWLKSDYEKKYNKMLDQVLESLPKNDICISCEGTLNVYTGGSIA